MADETVTESPTDQEVLDQSVKPFYYGKPQYISDEDRRRQLAEAAGESDKYIVQDATPGTGGVYPPSAVVTPFSPEIVAEHTPGEQVPVTQPDTVDPQTPASIPPGSVAPEPASQTTPAEKT
jgi:uncharacterized protein YbjT (DUF2867 family)